jgi:hypothetical protein
MKVTRTIAIKGMGLLSLFYRILTTGTPVFTDQFQPDLRWEVSYRGKKKLREIKSKNF